MHPDRPNTLRLFLASCLTLFAELAIIRWLSTEVRIFAYAKNLALLLCFLGFGVGCALAAKRVYWWRSIQAILAVILLVRNPWAPRLFEGLSQTLGAGQDIAIWSTGTIRNWPNILLDAVIVGLLFFFLTTIFIPLGQLVSQELDSAPDRLRAYSWNLGASLFGIMLFSFVSFRALSPVFWFGLVLFGFALLQANWRRRFAVASLIVPAVLLLHEKATTDDFAIWTPYQRIDIQRSILRIGSGGPPSST